MKCQLCGDEFTPVKYNSKCCSKACQEERNRTLARWRFKKNQKEKKKAKKEKPMSISEVNEKAKAAGLSYGQYTAKGVQHGRANEHL